MTKKIPSIVIALITAAFATYAAISPLLSNPTENALAIVALVWTFVATASHALSDYLPEWYLSLVTDLDGFLSKIKKPKEETSEPKKETFLEETKRLTAELTKTTLTTISIFLVAGVVACTTASICDGLKAYAHHEPVAKPVLELICGCLPVDPAVCKAGGQGLDISADTAQNIYNAYCASSDAGIDASTSDASVSASTTVRLSKMSSREDVRAYLLAQGAKVVSD